MVYKVLKSLYFGVIFCLLSMISISTIAQIETPLSENPLEWLNCWLVEEKNPQGNTDYREQQIPTIIATLATVDQNGQPSTRTIQLSFNEDKNALVFYTHLNTQKVAHIKNNPLSAIHLWLPRTKRQIAIQGYAKPLGSEHAMTIWKKMPRWMQLNMTASDHASAIDSRQSLQRKVIEVEQQYPQDIPYSPNFIAFEIHPTYFSFYAANLGSFADKFVFVQQDNQWTVERHQP